jgi:potassium/chloride transporter 9
LQEIVFWGPLVPIGIIATTFSGELSALIGSSRVLKALADDDLFGSLLNFVKYGRTKSGNPWVAVIIAFIIAEVFFVIIHVFLRFNLINHNNCFKKLVLLVGSLNEIAPLVTIFYLLAYFGINLACLALDLASAPNFRYLNYYESHLKK